MSCGAYVAAAAAVAAAGCRISLVVDSAGGGDARSMGSAANEVDRRMDPFHLLKATEAERSGVSVGIEA